MAIHYLLELTIRVGVIYIGIGAGILLQKWSKADQVGKWILFVGLNIFTPLLLILVFLNIETFSDVNWWLIASIASLGLIVPMIINRILIKKEEISIAKKKASLSDEESSSIEEISLAQKGAELTSSGFMNALFFPFPIIIGILPDHLQAEGLLAASLYLLAQTILRNSLGVYMGIHYGTNSNSDSKRSVLKILRGLILFPPTIGMIVGLILRFTIGFVDTSTNITADIFRDATMVLMLIIVGLSFRFPKKEEWKEKVLIRGIISRFGGGLLSIVPIFFMPVPLVAKIPLIIQTMAPPAVANSAYAKYFKLDELLTSRFIAILTIIALIFLPGEIALLVWFGGGIL
ncbi:MAG: AEC family transporter [Candidatus Heimdallarchaeaceae archaeon]